MTESPWRGARGGEGGGVSPEHLAFLDKPSECKTQEGLDA